MHDVTGKVAVATGASRGIGAAVTRAFREAGARVAVVARDMEALDQRPASSGPATVTRSRLKRT